MALIFLLTFSLAAEVDCGLRGYDGTTIVKFACDATANSSALKINKTENTYGILLVDAANPAATKFRISTLSGTKALKKFTFGNGLCEPAYGENCSNNPTDCGSCCGDTQCNYGETCSTCPTDCGSCAYCGDRVCNGTENCNTCSDCACIGQTCVSGSCITPHWSCIAMTNPMPAPCYGDCTVVSSYPCSQYGSICTMCVFAYNMPSYNCYFDWQLGFRCDTVWQEYYQPQQCYCS